MQALSSSHLICVPSGASISYCKLFLRSAECTGFYRPRSCPFTILNAAGGLRRRRGREEIVARFGKQYRKESYYVEKLEREEEAAAVWEGAIILKRKTGHIEHCTTLERLGLSSLSSEVSKSTAASMGITVNTDNSSPSGTPLLVSIDVTRKMPRDLLLHGLIRTFISLPCNRCAKQAAQRVFSNFCLLLHEKPLMEPEQMRREELGDLRNDEEVEEEVDKMYFPFEEKEIDISKFIRDIVHLEITIDALCDPNCKGLCLKCGTNLNKSTCICRAQKKAILYEPS